MRPTHDPTRSAAALDELRGTDAAEAGRRGSRSSTATLRTSVTSVANRLAVVPVRSVFVVGVLAILAAIAAAVVLARTTAPSPVAAPVVTVPSATTPATTEGPGVVVQASGAVRSPGVYRLPVGSRVVDLLERSGGPAPDLDLDRVNLAAPLADGQRVWMPRLGESSAPIVAGAGEGSFSAATAIDVNHASADRLDSLPGIGPTLAAAIVADRERHGAFRSVDDLLRVKGLSRSKVDAVRDLVVIG